MKKIIVAGALCLTIGALAVVQNHLGGVGGLHRELRAWHPGGGRDSGEADAIAKHLGEGFVQVSAFDINRNGQLEAGEREALARGMAEGRVRFPAGHLPPPAVTQDTERFANHVAEMYQRVAPYDADKNGSLDESEQSTLKGALDRGELELAAAQH